MFDLSNFTPWVFFSDAGFICALLLIGKFLRVKVRLIQRLFIPPSLLAGLLGLAVVFVFMVIYYRFCGVVADLALAVNTVLVLGTMALTKATITLPGIAGMVLTTESLVADKPDPQADAAANAAAMAAAQGGGMY